MGSGCTEWECGGGEVDDPGVQSGNVVGEVEDPGVQSGNVVGVR